ncbi:MAG: amidohydrolase family protein [Pseudomonadales bacterium]|nr:amidohydrolase family protein [Pseudomonadales bacterium]
MYDTIIKGGTIYDGNGGDPVTGDVAIKDGLIVAVGEVEGTAARTIDADGAIVAPAWIDIHTHYDGQVTWDTDMNPSASHGVGTIVMGNCGVGFAPVAPGDEKDLIELMEGVEDIPGTALYEGMPWGSWNTYPEYLDFLASREYALNISSLVAHGAVRSYVMGERGRTNQAATAEDLEKMGAIVEEALNAGAVGFSTSRILGHRSIQGEPVPGTFANDDEVMAIAGALKRSGKGVFQIIPSSTLGPGRPEMQEHSSLEQEIGLISRVSKDSGRPATFTLFQIDDWSDKWREALELVRKGNAEGARVFPQVGSRPTGLVLSMETYHPWMLRPTWRALKSLPLDQRLAELRKPEVKRAILSEENHIDGVPMGSMEFGISMAEFDHTQTYKLTSNSNYEPTEAESFAQLADGTNQPPEALVYDYLAADAGHMAIVFFTNYTDYNLEAVREMQLDECTVTGLSDAGAHVSLIFDGVNPTYQLSYWTRDRERGDKLPLSYVIYRGTRRNAELFGFHDRGVIAPGKKADINVIDYNNLSLGDIQICADLPAGGRRILQGAKGYRATLINGIATRLNDEDTGARPGRLIRSA